MARICLYIQLEEMEACLEKTEVTDLETNPEEIESESVHHKVPNEEAAVESVGAQEGRSEDQRPAVVCRNPRKRRIRGDFARGEPEGPLVEKKRRKGPECNSGVRNRGVKQQLRLGSKERHFMRLSDKPSGCRSQRE
jgi:hypothetical protein